MKQDIEYAALPMGNQVELLAGHYKWVNRAKPFRPLTNDGDSRRLERACMRWSLAKYGHGSIPEPFASLIEAVVDARTKGTDAEDNAAVLAWAVAIGKVIDGGGV